ncbi:MAG: tetratricopeptide repeat protein [Muribaculaceae bacterium]|nr:tetratricopeptide repeat protein [Muribaculaceae bacterium]
MTIRIKIKTIVIACLLAIISSVPAMAEEFTTATPINSEQYNKWKTSKPFTQALEALQKDEIKDAVKGFTQELKLHPDNAYAMCNLAQANCLMRLEQLLDETDYYRADTATVIAANKKFKELVSSDAKYLETSITKLPPQDKESQCAAYLALAEILSTYCYDDEDAILKAFNNAIACHPCKESYFARISYMYENNENFISHIEDDAKAVYSIAPNDASAVKLMALVCYEKKDYDGFINHYDEYQAIAKAEELQPDYDLDMLYASILEDNNLTDDAIALYLKIIAYSQKTTALKKLLAIIKNDESTADVVLSTIKQMQFAEEGDDEVWGIIQGIIFKDCLKDYDSAISYYKEMLDANPGVSYYMQSLSQCYMMKGDIANAKLYTQASDIVDNSNKYRSLLFQLGEIAPLLDYYNTANTTIDFFDYSDNYYTSQAILHTMNHDYDKAIEILSMGIANGKESPEIDYYYGYALNRMGRYDEAMTYLQKALSKKDEGEELDRVTSILLKLELGDSDNAKEEIDDLSREWLQNLEYNIPGFESMNSLDAYDLACLYSLAGDTDKAMEFMRLHFEQDKFPYNFGLISKDFQLDNLRSLPEFQELINKYYFEWKSNNKK